MQNSKKRLYEGMYIISATLSDDARQKALEKVNQSITSRGGEILKTHEMGKKKLAYEIRGQREGFYFVLYFKLPSNELSSLWKEHHLHEDLIRFTTLSAESVVEEFDFPQLATSQERR